MDEKESDLKNIYDDNGSGVCFMRLYGAEQ